MLEYCSFLAGYDWICALGGKGKNGGVAGWVR